MQHLANAVGPGLPNLPHRCQCCRVRGEVTPLAVLVCCHGQVRPCHCRQQVHEGSAQHGARDLVRPAVARRPRGSQGRCKTGQQHGNAAHVLHVNQAWSEYDPASYLSCTWQGVIHRKPASLEGSAMLEPCSTGSKRWIRTACAL